MRLIIISLDEPKKLSGFVKLPILAYKLSEKINSKFSNKSKLYKCTIEYFHKTQNERAMPSLQYGLNLCILKLICVYQILMEI